MAIQFDCVACGKPVEVDDQWGGRLVECPYCHETITAPAYPAHVSRPPAPLTAIPASPGRPQPLRSLPGAPPAYPGAPVSPGVAQAGTNRVAVVALVLALLSLVVGFGAALAVGTVATRELGMNPTEAQVNEFMRKAVEQGAPWLVTFGLAAVASFGLWLAGLVCGIVGVCRPRRGIAIGALIVLGLPLLLMVAGVLAG